MSKGRLEKWGNKDQSGVYHSERSGALSVDEGENRMAADLFDSEAETRTEKNRCEAARELLAREQEKRGKMKESSERMRALAMTDSLTGAWSRPWLQGQLQIMKDSPEMKNGSFSMGVIMADIDHFKVFNDKYGHPAGDEVLRRVAGKLKEIVRENDALVRFGGEEFLILLRGKEGSPISEDQLRGVMDRLLQGLRKLTVYVGQKKKEEVGGDEERDDKIREASPIRMSFGGTIVTARDLGAITEEEIAKNDLGKLIERADGALYEAKEAGRDRWTIVRLDGQKESSEDDSDGDPISYEKDWVAA